MSCSAFFVLAIIVLNIFTAVEVNAAQQAPAWCESYPLSIQLRRGDVTGTGNNSPTQTVAINTTQSAQITIGTPIDLNLAADVNNSFSNIVTTDPSGILWRATSEKNRGFKGDLTAEYAFSGLAYADNKICSSPNSCLTVTNVNSTVIPTETEVKGKELVTITAEGQVQLTLDISQASASGNYRANLSISIYDNGPNGPVLVDCL